MVSDNWSLLGKSKTTRPLESANIVFGLRRNKNLADFPVRASTKSTEPTQSTLDRNPCKRSKTCCYCPQLNRSGFIRSNTKGNRFQSIENVNCQSLNLIYLITCINCGIQYVGQTKNRLLTRFQGHINGIEHDWDTTVARHFNRCPIDNPSYFAGLNISVISFIPSPPESYTAKQHRDREEKRWMLRLSTITPLGLNLMD